MWTPSQFEFETPALIGITIALVAVSSKSGNHYENKYSQTCVQRPPLGPQNCGCCWQVVIVQIYLYALNIKDNTLK